MRLGFTNGCFDLLHEGHMHLLTRAHEHCDTLFVAVNTDESVRRLKNGGRPVEPLGKRISNLMKTGLVNAIQKFDTEHELLRLIKELDPDVIIKGSDYLRKPVSGSNLVKSVVYIPIKPGVSTTEIINGVHRQEDRAHDAQAKTRPYL